MSNKEFLKWMSQGAVKMSENDPVGSLPMESGLGKSDIQMITLALTFLKNGRVDSAIMVLSQLLPDGGSPDDVI